MRFLMIVEVLGPQLVSHIPDPSFQVINTGKETAEVTLLFTWAVSTCH